MISKAAFKEKIEIFYRSHKALLVHVSIAILWAMAIGLMYVVFPNDLPARIKFSRIIVMGILIQVFVLLVQKRFDVLKIIRDFFRGETYPINLAIFRIFLFGTIFFLVNRNIPQIVWFSELPKELQFPPLGSQWLISLIPINATIAQTTSWILKIFSFTAMIGLFTPISAWLTVILSFYVLGIPQFYGKVDHYHHLLWFAVILSASRCADVLSLDAIFIAWKRSDRGQVEPPGLSKVYGLPLRFVWLLLGIIYFFPGLYKLGGGGFDWAFSDNLKYQMYSKWLELDGWLPVFRLDKYPILYQISALGSIGFELSFIALIFFSQIRYLAAFGGLIFHNMTLLLMNIGFFTIQRCYVAFFDWNAIFHWIGYRLFPKDMYVVYDGNCKLCRRTIATLSVFDILGRITFVNALDDQALTAHNLLWLDSQALLVDMHAVVQTKYWKGFKAYRVLAARIPILWPILPLLYVWPIPEISNYIYRRVADSRTCSIPQSQILKPNYQPRNSLQTVTIIGILLLTTNILFGLARIVDGWPFACYPTFGYLAGPQVESLEVVPLSATGTPITLDKKDFKKQIPPQRFQGLTQRILRSNEEPIKQNRQLTALWQAFSRNSPNLEQVKSVQFYKTKLWSEPERKQKNPINRSLIFELKL